MRHPKVLRLDVTLRKAEDVAKLEEQIKEKDKQIARLSAEVFRFSQYASANLRLYDELRAAKDALDAAGVDSSFITSVKGRKRKRKGKG